MRRRTEYEAYLVRMRAYYRIKQLEQPAWIEAARRHYSLLYYTTDVNQQEHDYINLLKIMVIVILKINEEFCLMNPV